MSSRSPLTSIPPSGGLSVRGARRRALLGLAPALGLLSAAPARAQQAADASAAPLDRPLVLSGPPATVSYPLVHLVDSGALNDVAPGARFQLWHNPDQLRAWAVRDGADFMAMPSNVAANLYNQGVPLRLLNVSTWGMLWLVTRDASRRTLEDFRGQEIAMPFRADMPDILFGLLATRLGLDPKRDFSLRHVPTPFDAIQLLLTRRVDHALLPEPAVSMALRKSDSFPVSIVAPTLYRGVDLSQAWGRILEREPRIPQAGLVAVGPLHADARLADRLRRGYADSLAWCLAHPQECGEAVARHIPMLTPEAVADSIAQARERAVDAREARPELEYFFRCLLDGQPALVGGRLPDDGFYA
ncbi:ABC transporter substrate-binding protein [Castellaniella defragrans]|uniref:ABC transporter substrate-binding protein n=1 Tax=Castellaniella defragrans TaxID=75697 RepID=UPI0023F4D10D|nr:ABC transporter substrate-binding protein [Castellaniella defragrans]